MLSRLHVGKEYRGTDIAGRNTFESWKNGQTEQDLSDAIVDFVLAHMDDDAQEDRWRTKMQKRIVAAVNEQARAMVTHIDERMDKLEGSLRDAVDAKGGSPGGPGGASLHADA